MGARSLLSLHRLPLTCRAQAALNMMTRTSAADYAQSHIYMTAVDTGWINDEKPAAKAAADEKVHNFQTPIDEIGARLHLCRARAWLRD